MTRLKKGIAVVLCAAMLTGNVVTPVSDVLAASAEETAYTAASKDLEAKTAAYNNAKAEKENAASSYEKIQGELKTAQTAVENAKKEAESTKKTYEEKKKTVDAKESGYKEASAKKAKGSYAFFESLGSEGAMKALTSCTYKDKINMGADGDATSLENVSKTFEQMKYLNDLRKKLGLGELKVTSTLMAQAEADCDYSDSIIGHARQFNVGENLAWNFGSNPYTQWYANEKVIFDNAAKSLGQNSELLGKAAYDYYNAHEDAVDSYIANNYSGKSVGHYMNDIDPYYTVTGFAINSKGTMYPYTYGQVFDYSSSEDSYTVDEYEKLFKDYSTDIFNTIETYEKAKAVMDTALESKNSAETKLKNAEASLKSKQTELSNAETTNKTAAGAFETAESEFNAATAAFASAEAAYKAYVAKTGEASSEVLKKDAVPDPEGKSSYSILDASSAAYVAPADPSATVITIPDTVTINGTTYKVVLVSSEAFKYNSKLKKVVIGKNVKSIGENAFLNCKSLKTIIFKTKKMTKKSFGKNAFKGINKKATITVPKKKFKNYKKWLKNTGIKKSVKIKKSK